MSDFGNGSAGAPVTPRDVARARSVLRSVAGWALSPARWVEAGRLVTAATAALATDNGSALQASVAGLTLLGPVRAASAGEQVGERAEVLADLTALADLLAELERMGDSQWLEADERDFPVAVSFPVSIYLGDETGHDRVRQAVEELLSSAGMEVIERDDPVLGSWWQRMRATLGRAASTPAGEEVLTTAGQAADIKLVLRPEAEIAALWMVNLAPLIASLEHTKDAVIYLGMVLIVKNDEALSVNRLSTRQQFILNHSPHLLAAPDRILASLGLAAAESRPVDGASATPEDRP